MGSSVALNCKVRRTLRPNTCRKYLGTFSRKRRFSRHGGRQKQNSLHSLLHDSSTHHRLHNRRKRKLVTAECVGGGPLHSPQTQKPRENARRRFGAPPGKPRNKRNCRFRGARPVCAGLAVTHLLR